MYHFRCIGAAQEVLIMSVCHHDHDPFVNMKEIPSIFENINKKRGSLFLYRPPWPEVGAFQGYEGARSLFADCELL